MVDPDSGEPVGRSTDVADAAKARGVDLQRELTTCQVETTTEVLRDRDELLAAITHLRRTAAEAAEQCGTRLLAVSLPPTVPHEFPITDTPRYHQIADRFGMIAYEQGISGCHVHVEVPDRDTAVRVCTHLRLWLPMLLALSANSAIYRCTDTGYASWRSVLWGRWPSSGPPPHLQSADEYDALLAAMQQSGAMLDDGMVYWDARPSAKFPTVEIRVADVPATAAETVLLAVLARASVMTALRAIEVGKQMPFIAEPLLRALYWRFARDGLEGQTPQALDSFIDELRPALTDAGDYEFARDELTRIRAAGNGAMRQRRAWSRNGDIQDVLTESAALTVA